MSLDPLSPQAVLDFWFDPANRQGWFRATPEFDRQLARQFGGLVEHAIAGRLDDWRENVDGALALVVLLDQMPLNIFRGQARAFAGEARSREVAGAAIDRGFDRDLSDAKMAFLYLPFMHSEALADQDRSVALFEAAGLDDNLRWARHHREIVRRFGRFPHRNAILGRPSTPEEQAWLASDDSFKG